ncbi:MAG TPA: hypothetical protein VGD61_23655 [Pyrinomonadaceae bacterium]
MKRRNTKKQLRRLEPELARVVTKYLHASQRVHHGVLATHENEIERILSYLVDCHLRLDRSWPNRERWFDGLETFVWKKSTPILSGKCELWWGHLANMAGAEVKESIAA